MLNISPYSIDKDIDRSRFKSFSVENRNSGKTLIRLLIGLGVLGMIILFLPWTQNIRTHGNVTALNPEQRPHAIQSVIGGRIEQWFVQEGDFVNKGDTIVYISEIKDQYMDPNLLGRTKERLKAKEMSVRSYMEKVKALDNQIDALAQTGQLKFEQAQNKLRQASLKVQSDSIDLKASKIQFQIAREQYDRMDQLHKDGLKSLTDLEKRILTLQKAQAEMISAENDLLASENEVINARVELTSIRAKYRDEIAKAESEKYSALSSMYETEEEVTRLQNQYMNYSVRSGMYYITAPQDGYVTKAVQSGIGETLKEGDAVVTIMPAQYRLAVEVYVKPLDLPLLEKDQKVKVFFDGWPAIVFSGWPNTSYGTYDGEIFAVDNYISDNGMYRVLVAPDEKEYPWPDALRVGSGATSIILLKDVPIWYEMWRNINGFPPDFYKKKNLETYTGIEKKRKP